MLQSVLNAWPCSSILKIGRGMRLSPSTGKTDCRIMDFVDNSTELNVVSLPSLFGLDPAEIEEEGRTLRLPIEFTFLMTCNLENINTLEAKSAARAAPSVLVPGHESHNLDYLSDPRYENATVTYIDHDDPFSLMDDGTGAPNIFRLSRNAWVGCGDNIYVLPCLQYGDVRVQPKQDDEGANFPWLKSISAR